MAEKVHKVGLVREADYLYFIDKQGDISRTPIPNKGEKAQDSKTLSS
jgi:hypothetical protein